MLGKGLPTKMFKQETDIISVHLMNSTGRNAEGGGQDGGLAAIHERLTTHFVINIFVY